MREVHRDQLDTVPAFRVARYEDGVLKGWLSFIDLCQDPCCDSYQWKAWEPKAAIVFNPSTFSGVYDDDEYEPQTWAQALATLKEANWRFFEANATEISDAYNDPCPTFLHECECTECGRTDTCEPGDICVECDGSMEVPA